MESSPIGPLVVQWHAREGRRLAWRDTFDPYRIWIAEVVFQQTRIGQGIGHYERFMERFPDLPSLAAAPLDAVLKAWEGLGYYSRARNLHAAARELMERYGGEFPQDYRELLTLKGIGPYTARAIGSFAFGNPVGVLDGNVIRVAARLLGEHEPVDRPAVRKRLQEQADRWAASADSRRFNHGMMDLGSVVCTPAKPGCLICPLEAHCLARKAGAAHLIPRKSPKAARKTRYFHFYFVRNSSGEFLIRRRPDRGVWGGLWEIPNQEVSEAQWLRQEDPAGGQPLGTELKHSFTHFDMMIRVFEATPALAPPGDQYISQENIAIFAFSKAVLNIFGAVLPAPQSPPPAYG